MSSISATPMFDIKTQLKEVKLLHKNYLPAISASDVSSASANDSESSLCVSSSITSVCINIENISKLELSKFHLTYIILLTLGMKGTLTCIV